MGSFPGVLSYHTRLLCFAVVGFFTEANPVVNTIFVKDNNV